MALRPDMEVREYLDVVVRRKWLVVFSFLFVLLAGSVYSVVVPEVFKSTTTILVIPQRVPENYVQSTVSIGVADRLATIQQQVMSRTRLLTVVDEVGLFSDVRTKRPPEELLENMRKRIEINVASDRRRRDQGTEAFSISFEDGNPKLAMLTVSRLASLFIEENLKTREQQAVGTSEFLDSQLKETKTKLEAQEDRIKQYKLHFMGELPQELQTNLTALTRLQDHYRTNSEAIRAAEDRKVFVEAQLSMLERAAAQGAVQPEGAVAGSHPGQDPYQALAAELTLRRTRLADLSTRYTDRYPEIPRLRREVQQMEARLEQMRISPPTSDNQTARGGGALASAPSVAPREMEEVRRLRAQVTATESEIASLKREREGIQKRLADLQSKVDRSPRREQEMISLTRDYDNLKLSYNDLLRKKLEADISQNLEKRQKGEQFQIIDPANYPTTPFKPDRKMILGLSFVLACVIGLGGAFGLEMADTSLRSSREFKHFFDLPILATIPVLQVEPYGKSASIRKLSIYGGIVSFAVAASVFVVLYGHKIRAILNF